MDWNIFHAYDVRGIYPTEINEEIFKRIAKTYALCFHSKEVVVGMDARLSSPSLKDSIIEGLLEVGVDVVDIGGITTDMLYYSVGAYNYSGGIVISASHNPGKYNGLKFVREKAAAISSDTGLFQIRDLLTINKDREIKSSRKGKYSTKNVHKDYIKHVLSFIDTSRIKSKKIVANTNFGYANRNISTISKELNIDLIPINFETDGSFPKGAPDPMLKSNRIETQNLIKENSADFAVAWDADADRAMFFDENAEFISGVYITALLSKIMIKKYGKGNKIIFDPRVIWPVEKAVHEAEGIPIISKGGHSFMKDRMRLENALFGGELSAHYYFRDNFYADNGLIPFLLILEYLSSTDKQFSEVIYPYKKNHYMSGELNYEVRDIKKIMGDVQRKYAQLGKMDFIDGISIASKEWRFNIRPSNTEPYLRLNIETVSQNLLDSLKQDIEKIIHE